jgi:vitamin B12 transporter
MQRTYSLLAISALLALASPPAAALAEQAAVPVQVASLAADDLGLFFDKADLEMVESASRAPKPITQVAENITVITAADIERWNAHDLNAVLQRVAGCFVGSMGSEVANLSNLLIQGSDYDQVQIFVDGMRWNYVDNYYNPVNQIPVEIIDRVEVIKGPASSAWGSAFGGMVNIITKGAGTSEQPSGTLTGSLGEGRARGGSLQVAGASGPLGYYLHGGLLDAEGLRGERWYDNQDLFAKLSLPLPAQTTLTLSFLHSDPNSQYMVSDLFGKNTWEDANRMVTATLARPLGQSFHLVLFGALLDREYTDYREDNTTSAAFWDMTSEQSSHSGAVRVYGDVANHTLSLGAESYRNSYDYREALSAAYEPAAWEETWAVYLNDTMRWGRATITPGLRYDALSLGDSQLSPSLGITFRLNETNLLRAAAARGFRKPMPLNKYGSQLSWFGASPRYESEVVDSYQLGIENVALPSLRLKATLFRHQAKDTWSIKWDNEQQLSFWNNDGEAITRNGCEFEVETERFAGLALQANHTVVQFHYGNGRDRGDTSTSNLILDYQGPWQFSGLLAANYVWFTTGTYEQHQDLTWDATATKAIDLGGRYRLDLFTTVRNLFNGGQYDDNEHINSNRWLEAGLRLHF